MIEYPYKLLKEKDEHIVELKAERDRLTVALAGVAQWFEENDNLPYATEIRATLSGEGMKT